MLGSFERFAERALGAGRDRGRRGGEGLGCWPART
jgi:hypothetical protein